MGPSTVGEVVDKVRTDVDGAVWHVQLSDPGRRNAIDLTMRDRLAVVLSEADQDPSCRAIVLSGAGGVFCAGGDLSSMSDDDVMGRRRMHALADVARRLVRASTPVVAAVDGYAYGAGLSLALACDHIVASPAAKFCCSFGAVGLTADAGLHWSLPQRVGAARARRLILFGEVVDVAWARDWGLVDVVADAPSCVDVAMERAQLLARRAPLAIAASKRILADTAAPLDVVLARESAEQQSLFGSEDFADARRAFFDKRPVTFEGR